jgi:hypothetical protein
LNEPKAPSINLTTRISEKILKVNLDYYIIGAATLSIATALFLVSSPQSVQKSDSTFIPYDYSRILKDNVLETSPDSNGEDATATSQANDIGINSDWKLRISKGLSETNYDSTISPKLEELERAPWGIGIIYKNCVFSEKSPNKTQSYICSFSKSGIDPKDILMVGDSHMEMFVPTILKAFEKSGINLSVMGRSGCPIGGLSLKNLDKVDRLNCEKIWSSGIATQFAGRKFDFVIASDYGTLESRQSKITSMKDLKRLSQKVILLGPTPGYDRLVECIGSDSSLVNCKIYKFDLLRNKEYQEIATSADVNFFPISQFFCSDDRRCPLLVGKTSVTRGDGSHLSSDFAVDLADSFWKYLTTL